MKMRAQIPGLDLPLRFLPQILAVLFFLVVPIFSGAEVAAVRVATGNYTSGNDCSVSSLNASTGNPNLILLSVALRNGNISSAPVFNTTPPQTFTQIGTMLGTNNRGELFVYQLGPNFTQGTASITITLNGAAGCVSAAVAFSGVGSVGTQATNTCSTTCTTTASVSGFASPGTGGVVFDAFVADSPSTATPGSGQGEQWECSTGSTCANTKILGAGSTSGPATSASWTMSSAPTAWDTMAIPLNPTSTTAVKLGLLTATRYENGNLIELKTEYEVSSLGFNLYREQNGRRTRLNSTLLAGTALLGGPLTPFTSGHSHVWLDRRKLDREKSDGPPDVNGQPAYWAEEVNLDGTATMFGPVYAELPRDSVTAALSPLVEKGSHSAIQPLDGLGRIQSDALSASQSENCETVNSGSRPVQRSGAQPPVTPLTQQQQYALAASRAVKITVCAEGWYRVTKAQLVSAGLNLDADARLLQLYANGVEQPIVVRGEWNENPNPQDSIEFYGYPLNTKWSGVQVYWLVQGETKGRRVPTEASETHAKAGAAYFPASVVWNPRTLYFTALLDGDADNFFGPVITNSPVTNSFTLTRLAASAPSGGRLRVLLQGVSAGNHVVGVLLNSYPLGTVNFENQEAGSATLTVPSSVLHDGSDNILTLTAEGGEEDVSLVNTVELTYPRTYFAEGDHLRFMAEAGRQETIGGFSNSQIEIVDITDPGAPWIVPEVVTKQDKDYATTFVPQGLGTRILLAVAGHYKQPAGLTSNHSSHWHEAQPGADVVIISHKDFLSSLAPLRKLREEQGYRVAAIEVQDLFDEFNFGVKSPYAIKNFLRTARTEWTRKPHFVLLVGDATFDPRNYLGVGDDDFVPTYLVDTQYLETASDDWFSDFNLNGLPEMAVGRLPVRIASDAAMLANRIVRYETSTSGAWTNQVLLVAGIDDSADPFTSYIAKIQSLVPPTETLSVLSQASDPNAHDDLIASLNAGQLLVNFAGHGSEQVWAGGLLSSSDVAALNNGPQTPLFISMTCLNGYFQDVYAVALAKAVMLAPSGGAVAAWASSGLTDSAPQAKLDQAMVSALFATPAPTLGDAAIAAKRTITDSDVRRTWILLGDPSTKLRR